MCLKFLWTIMFLIWCFSSSHFVIYGFQICFLVEIIVFYDFILLKKFDFLTELHPNSIFNYKR
ncbi:hypothetical protein Hanom_Chr15g01360051 [Helianthus anomalus]